MIRLKKTKELSNKIEIILKKMYYAVLFLGLVALALLSAAGYFESITASEPGWYHSIVFVYRFNILWIAAVIFMESSNPSKTISWILILLSLPLLGFILYILFGRSFRQARKASKKRKNNSDWLQVESTKQHADARLDASIQRLLLTTADSPYTSDNKVRILSQGEEKFRELFDAIRDAKHHVHLLYYILKDDRVGTELLELLEVKVKEGVAVRVIYDDVGSWTLSKQTKKRMKKSGVQMWPFFKVPLPVLSRDLNYRNHRKIAVIDGMVGFTGGFNIGDEYRGYTKPLGDWRDLHLKITGTAVHTLQSIFLDDWNFVSGEMLDSKAFFPEISPELSGDVRVQIAASGPDNEWKSMHSAFLKFISTAQNRLWIISPYLVPSESLINTLIVSAMSGVDVRIVMPAKMDHFFVYWAGQANVRRLLEGGVRIFSYTKGFVHSKMMTADGNLSTVGTVNLDNRSMEINFEVSAFMYDEEVAAELERIFLEDQSHSIEYALHEFQKRPWWRRIFEAMGRIVSPIQ